VAQPWRKSVTGHALLDGEIVAIDEPLVPCLCLGKGVRLVCIAFLSTAAPRRGTLPDLSKQPSPKLFL
jgi:hypothetical protein